MRSAAFVLLAALGLGVTGVGLVYGFEEPMEFVASNWRAWTLAYGVAPDPVSNEPLAPTLRQQIPVDRQLGQDRIDRLLAPVRSWLLSRGLQDHGPLSPEALARVLQNEEDSIAVADGMRPGVGGDPIKVELMRAEEVASTIERYDGLRAGAYVAVEAQRTMALYLDMVEAFKDLRLCLVAGVVDRGRRLAIISVLDEELTSWSRPLMEQLKQYIIRNEGY